MRTTKRSLTREIPVLEIFKMNGSTICAESTSDLEHYIVDHKTPRKSEDFFSTKLIHILNEEDVHFQLHYQSQYLMITRIF